ncbi:MAG: hypothetical protein A7316_00815 [Candidatus Altiarchaeales archaeon WOR_SM1_86-2]|nr:MAG: hypothetical protein A7316_00815 [Candidatus Altiarchaeales archaeon WOR_SM1_86-2]
MKSIATRERDKQVYGALQGKSIRSILIKKLVEPYGYSDKTRIAEALVDDILDEIDRCMPKSDRVKPGQLVYLAKAKNAKPVYGQKMKDTKQVPVVLTFINPDDIKRYKNGKSRKEICNDRISRMAAEAIEQGGSMIQSDFASLFSLSVGAISANLKEHEQNNKVSVKTWGKLNDVGRKPTHKGEAIYWHMQGYLAPDIAKKIDHELNNVERYIGDFERIKELAGRYDEYQISRFTKLTVPTIREYLGIVRTYYPGYIRHKCPIYLLWMKLFLCCSCFISCFFKIFQICSLLMCSKPPAAH